MIVLTNLPNKKILPTTLERNVQSLNAIRLCRSKRSGDDDLGTEEFLRAWNFDGALVGTGIGHGELHDELGIPMVEIRGEQFDRGSPGRSGVRTIGAKTHLGRLR